MGWANCQFFCWFFSKPNKNSHVLGLEEAKLVSSIGIVSTAESTGVLRKHGFVNYHELINSDTGLKQLLHGRISLWLESPQTVRYLFNKHGVPNEQIKSLFTFYTGDLYLAFSNSTDDKIVNLWRQALATIKANGRFDAIVKQYEPEIRPTKD